MKRISAVFVVGVLVGVGLGAVAATALEAPPAQAGRVTGIGGVFFKAEDPDALQAWYREHLAIEPGPQGTHFLWRLEDEPDRVGRTVWTIFPPDSDYFGPGHQQFMLNYRVDDLDALLARLREAGVAQVGELEEYPYGRFAWVLDGEDNRVELWEPVDEVREIR